MKIKLTIAVLPIVLASCVMKNPVFQAEVVSMTHANSDQQKKLAPGQAIETSWCKGDPLLKDDGDHIIGGSDQVILKAQKEAKANFIVDVDIKVDANNCYYLTGKVGS
jgi:hypothetical protein